MSRTQFGCLLLVAVVGVMTGCAEPSSPSTSTEPWTLEAYEGPTEGPKVLVLHDMEGLAGQDDPASFDFGTDAYEFGQELLAADVNAVIEGLFAGGASAVLVVDGHGSGNPAPDLRADLLDPRATQIFRDAPFDSYFDLPGSEAIDAVAVVAMHAKTGSGGFASHTWTAGMEFVINGRSVTETELVALSWGRVGIPVVFASGDDRLGADLRTMPWLEYVTVKEAMAADSARLRPVAEVRAQMTSAARRSVERLASAKVMKVSQPVRATLRVVPPASLDPLRGIPGLDYQGDSISFVTQELGEAYDGLVALVELASGLGYVPILIEALRSRPEYREALGAGRRLWFSRWFDQESGRAPSHEATPAEPERQRYHGGR